MTLLLDSGASQRDPMLRPPALPVPAATVSVNWTEFLDPLAQLLNRHGWSGSRRQILEALPSEARANPMADLRDILGRLGYVSALHTADGFSLDDLRRIAGPADKAVGVMLHIPLGAAPTLVEVLENRFVVTRPQAEATPATAGGDDALPAGTLVTVRPGTLPHSGTERQGWLRSRIGESTPLIFASMALTLMANLLALANPLFVMTVYDKVIAANTPWLLVPLGIGAIGASLFELTMRRLRSHTMAHAGARLGYVVGNAVFGRLLSLPSALTERVSIAAQVARVRDIDRVRDLLTGPLAQATLDLPFMFLFIAAIFVLGGWLGLVPLVAVGVYGLLAFVANAVTRYRVTQAAVANSRRQELTLEIIERMRSIRTLGLVDIWRDRYDTVARNAAEANLRYGQASATTSTISQILGTMTALVTLVFGVHRVLAGDLTTGGLIASMMLIWRMLGPLQAAFMASARVGQIRSSIRQIETLMATPPERSETVRPDRVAEIQGRVSFTRVTFRYHREPEPILANVGFEVAPREVVAIVGRCGGGKSTVLKLISGLYTAQGGSVRIDGRDIRQFDPIQLRRSIAFVTQVPQFFQGSLADNLRLAAPLASDAELIDALDQAGALDTVKGLKDGLDTCFDMHSAPLPTGVLARLSLARAYLRNTPLVLLDEPISGFDFEGEFAFMSAIEMLRQRSTVFFATHRRGHLGIADKVLILENGTTRYFGTAEKVRDRIPRGMI
ncbi:peptidase domain-containing ABC transporter [Nitrospirillum amazonense]|uniref:ATP-binding cassette subfamily C protein/ATP-binding cassette subfamily C protein LapB n=1 Tax=Nitrospirillum amazonense TaxID=28077 RepID=A0A560J697_9PROT|nr:peptidase domain-containing ABC transporter [Nitrospirillum amazonense]MDG3439572.1 peptidase domain-containing ABC transporter [Nitrospirillum amazonense]TWB65979.1 ATP-binding cassette subfamily C protein/ATP-binding cassette subfamily C protein LapB [Nitrospirillum amazonense]